MFERTWCKRSNGSRSDGIGQGYFCLSQDNFYRFLTPFLSLNERARVPSLAKASAGAAWPIGIKH
jgi:hypothetical protein